MQPQTKTQPKLTFDSKLNITKLQARKNIDEVGKWRCDSCGGGNPDSEMFCQWCGAN